MVDRRNINTLWASVVSTTLRCLGLTTVVVAPGSRSAPLAVAFAQEPHLRAVPVLDERSAGFFALGSAKRTGQPVVLLCTSGTAAANFLPAVIEAWYSRVPLLVLTADRPPELRHCHAGQAIDQLKLYGNYVNWFVEVGTPDILQLPYLRNTLIQAWRACLSPQPGPVHLNFSFREPLAPIPQSEFSIPDVGQDFFEHCRPQPARAVTVQLGDLVEQWQRYDRGLIIAGPAQPPAPQAYCTAVSRLSQTLGFPVLAEGLSPLRNYQAINPYLVAYYDLILRGPVPTPEIVIQLGELPTSKTLRRWLQNHPAVDRYIIDPGLDNLDALHGRSWPVVANILDLAQQCSLTPRHPLPGYLQQWLALEQKVRCRVDQTMGAIATGLEAKIPWLLPQILPPQTPIFIANSMPVRDVEMFWQPNDGEFYPYFSRGASGIDGTLSTALGIAHQNRPTVLLSGDLALLHDTNGFLIRSHFQGHLTIILINNNGGGIFETLPIAQLGSDFETFFATPQNINFADLARTYAVTYQHMQSWADLGELLGTLPIQGIRLVEILCDRKLNAQWRRENLPNFAV